MGNNNQTKHPDMIEDGAKPAGEAKGPEVYSVSDGPDTTDDFGNASKIDPATTEAAKASQLEGLSGTEIKSLNPDSRVPRPSDESDVEVAEFTKAEVEDARGAEDVEFMTFIAKIEKSEVIHLNPRIYEHELPILEEMWGADKVSVVPETEVMVHVTTSAAQEFERLLRVRGDDGAVAVKAIYPSAQALARALGMASPSRVRSYAGKLKEQRQSAQRGTVL